MRSPLRSLLPSRRNTDVFAASPHGRRHSSDRFPLSAGGSRRTRLIGGGGLLLVEDTGTHDPYFIEHIHGQGHQTLIEGIGRRRQNRGDDERAEKRPLPIASQEGR